MPTTNSPGVYVFEVASPNAPIAGAGTSTPAFLGPVPNSLSTVPVDTPKLITNITEFKDAFGDFSTDPGQSLLALAVRGFFGNGGTRCYVARVTPPTSGEPDLTAALQALEPIDEIAMVAAPGLTSATTYAALIAHCEVATQSRFAILDAPLTVETSSKLDLELLTASPPTPKVSLLPGNSSYAALYFPWLQVFDPATSASKYVPPSGHMAGIYAQVDNNRGVHKAPANEVVFGVTGLKYAISKNQQDGLNPQGVNCIRSLDGNIRVWGARTAGGDANLDYKYVSARRLFIFLRESIDRGLSWAVFEPNDAALWAKITRNVSAFLNLVWRSGALFGASPEEAFFVKCDAETNPPAVRDLGQVVTEIGVALTSPAEFVVFKIGQKASES
jgi:hypothetical protein